jgi:tetratricopeptide (TPR) repeat protein
MITAPASQRRLLIPRWRSLSATLASQELAAPRAPSDLQRPSSFDRELLARLARWRKTPGTVAAAELLETALVHGHPSEAVAAARYLTRDADATRLVREQAEALVRRHEGAPLSPTHDDSIAYWRQRTRVYPQDALAWVELALAHITQHHVEPAKRAMKVALQLAPYDRHVLRSAARLYFHIHDPERAYTLIRRNDATPHDPWLMAAELALAMSIDKSPAFLKPAITMLEERSYVPRQLTELAGAAASNYLTGSGPHRRSRKFFTQSLSDPNANAVAQAEWASQTQVERFLEQERLRGFRFANEAQALFAYSEGRFQDSVVAARAWIAEEPFSSRAYLGAASAANLAEAYDEASEFAKAGLRYDPESIHLRNSLAFSLGSADRLDDAEQQLKAITPETADRVQVLVAEANLGLIAMRRKRFEIAEQHYRKAIDGFRQSNIPTLQKSAMAYLAREAARADHPKAASFIVEAKDGAPKNDQRNTLHVIAKAEVYLKEHASRRDVPSDS